MGEIQRLELHIDRRAFCCARLEISQHCLMNMQNFKENTELILQSQTSHSHRNITFPIFPPREITQMPLILNLTIPFTEFRAWSPRKIGNFGHLGRPLNICESFSSTDAVWIFPYANKQTLWGTCAARYERLQTSLWKKGTFPFHVTSYISLGQKGREKKNTVQSVDVGIGLTVCCLSSDWSLLMMSF